ncbi:MAG: GatB/YqeY domain-containing protein [Gammaproteobacteria bacterium]|nr:GatB/YqeY domain-containing protein [Gammaproteobacteria bacterium]
MSLKDTITEAVKASMKAKEKQKTATLRLITSAIKQIEVDERRELDDDDVITVLMKMVKQRRESIEQFTKGNRSDLAEVEEAELEIIKAYMPEPLTDTEIDTLIEKAIADSGAETIKDMGKVMGILKPQLQGRAEMGPVSGKIKAKLG